MLTHPMIASLFCLVLVPVVITPPADGLKLIAHRGGVVDAERIENNVTAVEEAIRRNYEMLEVDIRESKDGQLVVHHDATFRRFYGDGRALSELTWEEIQSLRSDPGQHVPLSFAQYAALCRGRIKLMLDTKGPDHEPPFFETMERILRENDLLDSAFVIGTQQSKQYFAGKAKVGIGIEALRTAIAEETDVAKKYFLFAHGKDLDESTVALADQHGVTVVPSVNVFHYPAGEHLERAAADLRRLKQLGVTYFQIDSVYQEFLRQ